MANEKFCLRWNDFENNISNAFRELRDDKDFFDVTLACDDDQMQAHKVILSACSPFFRNILRRNHHQHPLLYLKGVKYSDLQSVLNFMYHGEVNIAQDELNSFLAVAEDLKVKGLTQSQSGDSLKTTNQGVASSRKPNQLPAPKPQPSPRVTEREPPPAFKRPRPDPPVASSSFPTVSGDDDIQEVVPIKSEPMPPPAPEYTTHQPVALQEQVEDGSLDAYQDDSQVYDDYGQYGDEQHYQTAADTHSLQSYEGGKGNEADAINTHISKVLTENGWKFSCTLCGKENVQKGNVVKHVESVHFPNLFSYQCKFCEKQFSARNSLYAHVSRNHRT